MNLPQYCKFLLPFIFFSLIITCVVEAKNPPYKVMVKTSHVESTIEYFKSQNFWGETTHDKDLDVPPVLIAVVSKQWQAESQKVPVEVKKELFYRSVVPMVLYANELILRERNELVAMSNTYHSGKNFGVQEQNRLEELAKKYGVAEGDTSTRLNNLLERVDIVPASLALGQAAYESGYGTSRFMMEGNALFGQWTYGGGGMKPKEHRASKGDYGVASFEWPFDSIRSYMFNLNTHNAYQELRDKRAALRKQGKKPTGLELTETLTSYSEKGREYVTTLKSIIRKNGLEVADTAYLRDEPVTFVVGVKDDVEAGEAESELKRLQASGELERIIESMNLDLEN